MNWFLVQKRIKRGVSVLYLQYNYSIEKRKRQIGVYLFLFIFDTMSSAINIIVTIKSMNIIIGIISSLIKKNENSIMFNIIILLFLNHLHKNFVVSIL